MMGIPRNMLWPATGSRFSRLKENALNGRVEVLDSKAILVLVVLCASWGLQQVAIKIANVGISPVLQAGIRSAGAAMLVWIWMVVRRKAFLNKDGTFWWGIGAGLLFSAEFILIYWGLQFTVASRAVIFLYTSPFIVALGAQLFIPGESLRKTQVAGLCCAFCGVFIAVGESLQSPSISMLIGDGMLVGAAVFWGATTVLIKAGPLSRISPSKTLLYQLSISAMILPLGSLCMHESGIVQITPVIAGSLIYQSVWIAFITYLAWFWLVKKYPASRLASFTFLTPLFGVIAGGVLLDEPITAMLLLSLTLVAIGIYLVNRPFGE